MKKYLIPILFFFLANTASASILIVQPSSDLAMEVDSGVGHVGWTAVHDWLGAPNASYTTHGYVMGRADASGIIVRYYINFDTSALTSGATVSAVVLGMWGQDKDTGAARSYNVYGSTASIPVVAANYSSTTLTAATAYASDLTGANFKTDSTTEMVFTFNATGIAAINKTGTTKIVHREVTYDAGNTTPIDAAFNPYVDYLMLAASGTSVDPTMTITYTTAGGATAINSDSDFITFD